MLAWHRNGGTPRGVVSARPTRRDAPRAADRGALAVMRIRLRILWFPTDHGQAATTNDLRRVWRACSGCGEAGSLVRHASAHAARGTRSRGGASLPFRRRTGPGRRRARAVPRGRGLAVVVLGPGSFAGSARPGRVQGRPETREFWYLAVGDPPSGAAQPHGRAGSRHGRSAELQSTAVE